MQCLTEDNSIIFEDNGIVYVAPINNLDKRVPITIKDILNTCVASTDYIAYSYTYKENDVYVQGVEVYNSTNHTKALIKDCYLIMLFLMEILLLFLSTIQHIPIGFTL